MAVSIPPRPQRNCHRTSRGSALQCPGAPCAWQTNTLRRRPSRRSSSRSEGILQGPAGIGSRRRGKAEDLPNGKKGSSKSKKRRRGRVGSERVSTLPPKKCHREEEKEGVDVGGRLKRPFFPSPSGAPGDARSSLCAALALPPLCHPRASTFAL